MRLPIFNRHPRDEMSAFLDGELIPLRVDAMQVHLASCQSCRAGLEALRRLKVDLAALPEMPAPRSFALTPQLAALPVRERPRASVSARAAALANGMRLAGAAMTLALALVLVLDFTGSGTSNSDSALTAGSVQEITTTAHDSDKSLGSNSAPAPVADSGRLALTPTPTFVPRATLAAGGGGVSAPGSSSGDVTSSYDQASPAESLITGGDTPPPVIAQTFGTPSITNSTDAITSDNSLATSVPAVLAVPPASGAPGAAESASGSGGVDTLLIVALALAAGVVLTVAGSFVLPRLGRNQL